LPLTSRSASAGTGQPAPFGFAGVKEAMSLDMGCSTPQSFESKRPSLSGMRVPLLKHGVLAAPFALLLVFGLSRVSFAKAGAKEQIQQAIENGVRHLKGSQAADGSWQTHPVGATALAALALLESEVPSTDPAIQRAADYLRKSWVDVNDEHTTYAISLTILLLDRLGEAGDVPIIQALAVRLLSGQIATGEWSYHCPEIPEESLRRLKSLVEQHRELKATSSLPRPAIRSSGAKRALPKEIQQLLARLEQNQGAAQGRAQINMIGGGDNSNTQFAILGLWAARRHGMPVEKALARTANRFRTTQHADGGWGYMATLGNLPGLGDSTPSMTCAGLLGLALGYGSAREVVLRAGPRPAPAVGGTKKALPTEPGKDPAIRAGFAALGTAVGQPLGNAGQGFLAGGLSDPYYLLWSVERVAVSFSLPTLGGKDWYTWGAAYLLGAQQADGSWMGKFGADVDTSFALLFLRRANLNPDLTAHLKGERSVEVALKASGVAKKGAAKEGNLALGEIKGDKEKGSRERFAAEREASNGNTRTDNRAGENMDDGESRVANPTPLPLKTAAKNTEANAARLGAELLRASGKALDAALDQLRERKGAAYTDALAQTIVGLNGSAKNKARDALTQRLARMTPATLRAKLQDEMPEIRRAAALACAVRADKQLVPDLIPLLEDSLPTVARAAHVSLKELTGQDLGPAADATPAARDRAVAAWKDWWSKQSRKQD